MTTQNFNNLGFKKHLVYDEMISLLRLSKKSKIAKKNWSEYEKKLKKLNVREDIRFSIILWTQSHLKEHREQEFYHRMLHDLEKDMISTNAYGCLVEAVYFGIISWNDMDSILEEVVSEMSLPISSISIKTIIANRWFVEANDTDIKIN